MNYKNGSIRKLNLYAMVSIKLVIEIRVFVRGFIFVVPLFSPIYKVRNRILRYCKIKI